MFLTAIPEPVMCLGPHPVNLVYLISVTVDLVYNEYKHKSLSKNWKQHPTKQQVIHNFIYLTVLVSHQFIKLFMKVEGTGFVKRPNNCAQMFVALCKQMSRHATIW